MSFACDELSDRIRQILGPRLPIAEKKMFGGCAFMLAGNMLVAVTKEGGLLVRIGKERMAKHLALSGSEPVTMGVRIMAGFVHVSGDVLEDDDVLA